MKPNQNKLFNDLKKIDPSIAHAYYGAIKILEQNYEEKIPQSAHSTREILTIMSRPEYHQDMLNQQIPADEFRHAFKLSKTLDPLSRSPSHARQNYKEILEMYDWFVDVSHHGHSVTESEYLNKLSKFENLLSKIILPHDEVIINIDKLLKNGATKKNYGELKYLINRNMSSHNYFFNTVYSVKWFKFLQKDKYFDSPKHTEEINGQNMYLDWPPGNYLTVVAKNIPEQVSKIILNIIIPQNNDERSFRIMKYLVNMLLNMPPKYSKNLVKLIIKKHWMSDNNNNTLNINLELELLIKKLARFGYEKESLKLCSKLMMFNYMTSSENISYDVNNVQPIIGMYDYQNMLNTTIPKLYHYFPKSIIFLLIENLYSILCMLNKGKNRSSPVQDYSIHWCQSIKHNKQNFKHDFRTMLLELIGELLIKEGNRSMTDLHEEMELLSQKKYFSFIRLQLHIYRNFATSYIKEINNSAIKFFDNDDVIYEYYHMIKDHCQILTKKTIIKYLDLVEKGSNNKILECEKFSQIDAEKTVKNWKAKKIKPILKCLKNKQKMEYGWVKNEKLDFLDHIVRHNVVRSKPRTYLKNNLDADAVFTFIQTHHFSKEIFGYYDDTTSKFQEYVEMSPKEFSHRAMTLIDNDIDIIYISSLFKGIENVTSKKNNDMDWNVLLSLCEKLLNSDNDKLITKQVMENMARMLGSAMDYNIINFNYKEKIWKILKSLCMLSKDLDYVDVGDDSFTSAINSVFGNTFESIIYYISWHHKNVSNKYGLPYETKKLFCDYIDHKITNSIYGHAILGFNISYINDLDSKFCNKMALALFGANDNELCYAAWDSYIKNNIRHNLFEKFYAYYDKFVDQLKYLKLTKDGYLKENDKLLINHVLLAYMFKFNMSKKIFDDLINIKNKKIYAHCSWCIGRILNDQKKSPE